MTPNSQEEPLIKQPNGTGPVQKKEHQLRVLSNWSRLSYGVGHVLNDLTASMWFSYLLLYLHEVNSFHNVLAGNLMLIGQVSDALFTPFIGFESDRTNGLWKLGKRKTWHLLGTFCVMASFPFLFSKCIKCSHAPDIAQFVYYAPFVVIFQFGWAATQISHLSFSSDLTPYKHERVALQSIRNLFTVAANFSVYGIFFLLFYFDKSHNVSDDLNEADAPKFQQLALISIGIGTVFNFLFHLGTKENRERAPVSRNTEQNAGESSIEQSTILHARMSWKDWLKNKQFYQVALLYMATRLFINVSQVYFPMYLTETVELEKNSIALLPLVTYLSSFIMSMASSYINRYCGRNNSYIIGLLIGLGACVWLYFLEKKSNLIFGCAFLLGSSGSLVLITSLSMTSDLIASNTESGAFVFGAMSFTDKLTNGVAVVLIQVFHPCVECCPACKEYYRYIQAFVPGGSLVVAAIALAMLYTQTIGDRAKNRTVLKVLENPVRSEEGSSYPESHRCSCGLLYTPPITCSACGVPPNFTPCTTADVHSSYDTDEESYYTNEKQPLLRGRENINTPTQDLRYYTENHTSPKNTV